LTDNRLGLLIILSSPSGAGKSTLAARLRAWDPEISFSVSVTTRPPRPHEVEGQHYCFVDEAEFRRLVENGDLLEHAHVFGNWYGSPKAPVEEALSQGIDVLFDVDWQGTQQLLGTQHALQGTSIFLLPPSISALRERLQNRAQDTPETIAKRMEKSWDEISHWGAYDYVLINDDLEHTAERLIGIVAAERLRRARQPGLVDHVRKLQAEFEGLT